MRERVRIGTIVRVTLSGRRVRGWVIDLGVRPSAGVELKPIAKVTGWGPSEALIDLARWASWRWAGRVVHLLDTASPPAAVAALPPARGRSRSSPHARGHEVVLARTPPAADVTALVRAQVANGPQLIVAASIEVARRLGNQLRAEGFACGLAPRDWARGAAGGTTMLGARAAVWAPLPDIAGVVVLDEHDERLKEGRAPTWHARDVAVERARRAGVPCTLVSPTPSLESLQIAHRVVEPSRTDERAGWPLLDVVDRRKEDPRTAGLFSERFVRLLRDRDRGGVLCILNRTGRARLLVCRTCGEVARCERCDAAVVQPDEEKLHCLRCGTERPIVCAACGAQALKNARAGVARASEELAALAGERVGEGERVEIGTEALLHRNRSELGVVAFLDFDQELLAPRYRAGEEALSLLVLAARLLGRRTGGGRLLVQTRHPRHPVIDAVLKADPGIAVAAERARRSDLSLPPFCALATVSGPAAGDLVESLGNPLGIEVLGPADGRWLLRAEDHRTLCDALAATPRPHGRIRIEVDPLRI